MLAAAGLLAIQTYYALVVKLLAGQVVAGVQGADGPCRRIARASKEGTLQEEMASLESGQLFAPVQAVVDRAADPLAWYLDAWTDTLASAIAQLADCLSQFDTQLPAGPQGDVFGRLYQELLPRKLRHALGEYYTPDWLVEHVLDQTQRADDPTQRLLDPSCGSGAFLVTALARRRTQLLLSPKGRGAGGEGVLGNTTTSQCENGPSSGATGSASAVTGYGIDHAVYATQTHPPKSTGRASGTHELHAGETSQTLLHSVAGFDINPLAVMTARANCLLAVADLLSPEAPIELPVHLRDTILDPPGPDESFDVIVGNPPWIAWDNLPDEYRDRTKPLWREYGLFSLSGNAARHGGGKKDLAMLLLYAAADRYLRPGGRLGMVVTQTLFQSKGAGDGFRRFRLGPDGPPLAVLRADDLVRLKPFPGAANWTATVLLEKGRPTEYPVPYFKWSEAEGNGYTQHAFDARPIDSDRERSPWLLLPSGMKTPFDRLTGPSDYTAHLGANSGGANAVYWVELLGPADSGVKIRNLVGQAKRHVPQVEAVVETELLYPLLRWGDVARYRAEPTVCLLLVQDPQRRRGLDETLMREQYPKTLDYLAQFKSMLERRAAYRRYQEGGPFYAMYNVGSYTLAPIKVVWRRMDRRINAAVVEPIDHPWLGVRPVVPQETCVQVEVDTLEEAHYLCAALNSTVVNFLATAHSVDGGKGFGTPGMLDHLNLPRFNPADSRHASLSQLGTQVHRQTAQGIDTTQLQREIDTLTAEIWGLDPHDHELVASTP